MRKKQLVIISLLIIAIIGLPVTYFLYNQQQNIRSKAESATILTFAPSSSETAQIQTLVGETFPLDIMLNPGVNAVSQITLEILYDQAMLEPTGANPFDTNLTAFPQIPNGPIYAPGKITLSLSIGTDFSKVIQQPTRV